MPKRVVYLGPPGTNSEEAALIHDPSARFQDFPTVRGALAAVEAGQADEAVIAIENSLEGPVTENVDLLVHELRLLICKEIVLPISHCLLAKPSARIEDIRIVYSHPQALAQCRKFLEDRLHDAKAIASMSTVAAVEQMKGHDGGAAAIAPQRAAALHGVRVLAEGIQDNHENATRFVVLAHQDAPPTGDDKTSIAFYLDDRPGTLYRVIKEFAERSINLSKIESRPAKQSLGQYVFLVDFNRHRQDRDAQEALAAIQGVTSRLKVFGSYPRFRPAGRSASS